MLPRRISAIYLSVSLVRVVVSDRMMSNCEVVTKSFERNRTFWNVSHDTGRRCNELLSSASESYLGHSESWRYFRASGTAHIAEITFACITFLAQDSSTVQLEIVFTLQLPRLRQTFVRFAIISSREITATHNRAKFDAKKIHLWISCSTFPLSLRLFVLSGGSCLSRGA